MKMIIIKTKDSIKQQKEIVNRSILHIVFLTHVFPARGMSTGGAGNYVANFASILVQKGHKVTVITESSDEDVFYWNGIEVRHINVGKWFRNDGKKMWTFTKTVKNILRSFYYNHEVKKVNQKHRVDIVQTVNSYGIGLFRLSNIPYILRVSDYPALWSGANQISYDYNSCLKSKRIDEEISLIAIRKSDYVIAPSNRMKEIIELKTGKKVNVVETPVVIPFLDGYKQKRKMIPKDSYFLSYSAMIYRKSIHVIRSMIDDLLGDYPDMKYIIAGKDRLIYDDGKYIMASDYFYGGIKHNSDRFIFMGEIKEREEMLSLVKNARICILPTRIDNCPNTVLEAMALGKIVVSSDDTSVEELITDGENGFLSEIDSKEDLMRKIKFAMELDDDKRKRIENNAMKIVDKHNPESVYERMISIYKQVLSMQVKNVL